MYERGYLPRFPRPSVRTVNFGCYGRKAERGCSNTKGYNRGRKTTGASNSSAQEKVGVAVCGRVLPCARVKNRNSRQPLADDMALEEVPKKRRPGALTGGAPGQTMPCFMSRQPSRWLREGRNSVERKSADGAREDVPSPEAGGSDNLLKRMHYFALPCVRG